ncbi:MAG: ATP-binding protein [Acidobacteriota bacterium]|nr:ATP-binding protein [Acidobacteriota bacterium]
MADTDFQFFPRFSAKRVATALTDTPVAMLIGPRQCGKTTLVRQFADEDREYVTLDDDTVLEAARNDPTGFVRGFDRVTIDEVQRAPELLRAIKRSVDNDRRAGRFLLTGSANILTLPQVSESLAGRMEIVNLMPISRAEILGKEPTFLKMAFNSKLVKPGPEIVGDQLVHAVLVGGYPEMLRREDSRRRQAWARDYVKAIVQRDVRDIAEVEKLDQLPRLLQTLAHHSGQLTNFTQIGGQIGMDDKTTRKYIGILEQLFLVHRVSPWFRNELKRLIKTPKLHFTDSGLLAALLAMTPVQIEKNRSPFGAVLETFVFGEVMKQVRWSDAEYSLHHYRDKDQGEVDLIVEDEQGALVGIEVKASATVHASDFKGMRKLLDICGDDLKLGLVLYDGTKVVPFGDRLFAAPMSCLWN